MPPTSEPNSTTPSIHLDNATLRERILTSGAGNARGSLTKVVSQYRELIHQLMRAKNNNGTALSDDNDNNTNATPIETAATNLKTELLLHDLEIRKSLLTTRALSLNSTTSTSTLSEMQSSQSALQQEITSLTSKLQQQRQIHSYRKEYNALAKMANGKHPPIHETQSELERVNCQIQEVEREVKEAEKKLSVRERQMRVLMSCLGDLRAELREEEIVGESLENEVEEEEVKEGEVVEESAQPPAKKRKR